MAAKETLNSRLRILVAKTFRAEKLYSSMRNAYATKPIDSTEVANDLRAREWQRIHSDLRVALNDTLSLKSTNAIASRIICLRNHFSSQAQEASLALEKGTERLVASARRHEFAHTAKLSLEFVQRKAREQACQVVADELNEILISCGKIDVKPDAYKVSLSNNIIKETTFEEEKLDYSDKKVSNVIPFRRNIASAK